MSVQVYVSESLTTTEHFAFCSVENEQYTFIASDHAQSSITKVNRIPWLLTLYAIGKEYTKG